ncbi:cytochrome c3 family protein [Shewanella phaeophyticola]|uniref:Cytochrome c3 family protein n=1 Tax=Shewanella phaeophyticola TaxID=2978345 RepID=A0ABT2P7J1_9GAMM|nr:cytochrome c3 family protein [Shewanella sp. KJ10-1]MCT8987635.1 cytochrome c3 family protein [Shewanella sp. KJ10-1]
MKNRFVLFISVLALSFAGAGTVFANQEGFLSDIHIKNGLDCNSCHEGKPKKEAGIQACLDCHGGYDGMYEKTKALHINPHDAHEGDIECNECHKSHSTSIDYCASCHSFDFKVP